MSESAALLSSTSRLVVRPELLWITSHVPVSEPSRLAGCGHGLVRCHRGRSLRPCADCPSRGPSAQWQVARHHRGTHGWPVSRSARPHILLSSKPAGPGNADCGDDEPRLDLIEPPPSTRGLQSLPLVEKNCSMQCPGNQFNLGRKNSAPTPRTLHCAPHRLEMGLLADLVSRTLANNQNYLALLHHFFSPPRTSCASPTICLQSSITAASAVDSCIVSSAEPRTVSTTA